MPHGDYPFIKVSDMNLQGNQVKIQFANNWISDAVRSEIGAKLHPSTATVFAKIGVAITYNRRRRLVIPTIIDNNMMAATPQAGLVEPDFLYYLLTTVDFTTVGAGTALPYLRQQDLERIPVVVPPLDEQRRIAAVLGALDDKIELNRKMNRTLEEMAQAIFKSWFIDFDGHDDLVDSEIGPVPRGWGVAPLSELASVESGRRQKERVDGCAPEARVPLIGGAGQVAWTRDHLFDEPILVTGRVGTLGVVTRWSGRTWPSDNTLVVRARQPELFHFLYEHLRRLDLATLNRGSTQPLLTQRDLKTQAFAMPPREAMVAFHLVASSLYQRVCVNDEESRILADLRDTLLPKLISGELRVPEAEELAEVPVFSRKDAKPQRSSP
jgi:type I restriction enzyme S subunit